MPNIEIKEAEYHNCPYCHRIIPDYAICNCVKIYNQALEDFTRKLSVKFIELPLDDLIVADILNDVKGIYEQLKK